MGRGAVTSWASRVAVPPPVPPAECVPPGHAPPGIAGGAIDWNPYADIYSVIWPLVKDLAAGFGSPADPVRPLPSPPLALRRAGRSARVSPRQGDPCGPGLGCAEGAGHGCAGPGRQPGRRGRRPGRR